MVVGQYPQYFYESQVNTYILNNYNLSLQGINCYDGSMSGSGNIYSEDATDDNLKITSEASGDYLVYTIPNLFEIQQKELTITWTGNSPYTFDGNPHGWTYQINGLVAISGSNAGTIEAYHSSTKLATLTASSSSSSATMTDAGS